MRYPLDHFAAAGMLAVRTHKRTTRRNKLILKCVSRRYMLLLATHSNHGWFARSKFHESHGGLLWQGNRKIGTIQPSRTQNLHEKILTETLHARVIRGAEHENRIHFVP
ncbi:hypothetical protein Y032_0080g1360 [Ancylostoma ceylanicum]|nr:hypothetical protein Y032_0080g1360 [Ancylostoma ceylanicum]